VGRERIENEGFDMAESEGIKEHMLDKIRELGIEIGIVWQEPPPEMLNRQRAWGLG